MSEAQSRLGPAIGLMSVAAAAGAAPDREAAIAVIHAALDAGARLLDTANVYGPDAAGSAPATGHGERLVAEALRQWPGDRQTVTVATKGGLVRPARGPWVPDGKAKSLRAACEASVEALGGSPIDLYLLHAPDPRVPLATTGRALARLQRDGLVRRVGVCNVTCDQLEALSQHVELAAVQVELSPWRDAAVRGGVVERCIARGVTVLGYRPLSGARSVGRKLKDPVLRAVADAAGRTPASTVLAWLSSLPGVVPLPGPGTPAHARDCVEAVGHPLPEDGRARLDAHFAFADLLRRPRQARRPTTPTHAPVTDEVVLVMGIQGSGKSEHARRLVARGYQRLNRDTLGGRLADLVPRLHEALTSGQRRVVLDNTYPQRAARNAVIECAWQHGVHVRCVWPDVSGAQARVAIVGRMLETHGALPGPEAIAAADKHDTITLAPRVPTRFDQSLEPPHEDEGFFAIERPRWTPTPFGPRRLLVLFEAAMDASEDPSEDASEADEAFVAAVRRHVEAGARLVALRWAPVGRPAPSLEALRERFGVQVDLRVCPHAGGPAVCWCRPPLPGLVVAAAREHEADLAASTLIGQSSRAAAFARACGVGHFVLRDAFDAEAATRDPGRPAGGAGTDRAGE